MRVAQVCFLMLPNTCRGLANVSDDILSDDPIDNFATIMLPEPSLRTLAEIDQSIRIASNTQTGRDALCKFIINNDYIPKLLPLVMEAEDLEDLDDLHRLCCIMKSLILLNDNHIIELVVSDACILGVVGALECEYPGYLSTCLL